MWRARRHSPPAGHLGERLGYFQRQSKIKNCIWIHCVSVGETVAAVPLINALRSVVPQCPIVVSSTTETGAETVRRLLGSKVIDVYFPFDLPAAQRRFVQQFQPSLMLVMETELWPNCFKQCRESGIPLVLVNGRLSARSASMYQRVAAWSYQLLSCLTTIAAQSEADAKRFVQLGAAPECVHVTGSLKFDVELPASVFEHAAVLRRQLGVNRPVVVFGSTRDGEETLVLAALAELKTLFPDVLAVLAPRHPERFAEVKQLVSDKGFSLTSHSEQIACPANTDVYVLDAMGELARFYGAADVAFVGGSLLPYGGHNLLEPAGLGVAVITGPHTFNFAEIRTLLHDAGALQIAANENELANSVANWLSNSNERDRVGQRGRDVVRAHRGATGKVMRLLSPLLQDTH